MHFNKLLTPLQATELTLGFKIDMDVTDASLLDLDENILGCRHNRGSIQRTGQLYASVGFTACITEKFFKQQFDVCKCINVNGPPSQSTCVVLKYLNVGCKPNLFPTLFREILQLQWACVPGTAGLLKYENRAVEQKRPYNGMPSEL